MQVHDRGLSAQSPLKKGKRERERERGGLVTLACETCAKKMMKRSTRDGILMHSNGLCEQHSRIFFISFADNFH